MRKNTPTVETMLAYLDGEGFDVLAAFRATKAQGLGKLPVKWNGRLQTTAGRCHFIRQRSDSYGAGTRVVPTLIDLNPKLEKEGLSALYNTFLHELAHAMVGPAAGHGRRWRDAAVSIGCRGERCHSYESMARGQGRPRPWRATCCGRDYSRAGRPKWGAVYRCPLCRAAVEWEHHAS